MGSAGGMSAMGSGNTINTASPNSFGGGISTANSMNNDNNQFSSSNNSFSSPTNTNMMGNSLPKNGASASMASNDPFSSFGMASQSPPQQQQQQQQANNDPFGSLGGNNNTSGGNVFNF